MCALLLEVVLLEPWSSKFTSMSRAPQAHLLELLLFRIKPLAQAMFSCVEQLAWLEPLLKARCLTLEADVKEKGKEISERKTKNKIGSKAKYRKGFELT